MTGPVDDDHRTATRRAFLVGLSGLAVTAAACSDAGDPGLAASSATPSATPSATGRTSPPPSPSPTPAATPSSSPSSPARTSSADLVHGPRDKPLVALTFHGAGDPGLTRQVLREARSAGAHLTILAVGTWLSANPSLAGAILDAGHELGNHTWSHQPMRRLSSAQARVEIARDADLLQRLTGSPGTWFRPSGTPHSTATIRAAARANGYPRCLSFDVDPLDYTDPGPTSITRATLAQARAGSIVSLHLGHPGTVAALPDIFKGLSRNGLTPVTVTQLLEGAA